jgi:hypothetical protein
MRITRLAQFLSCFKSHDNIHKIGYRNQAFRSANTPLEVLQNPLSKNEHAQIGGLLSEGMSIAKAASGVGTSLYFMHILDKPTHTERLTISDWLPEHLPK